MSFSDVLSLAAVAIALGSLAVSAWVTWGDRAKLKVSSEFIPEYEDCLAAIHVQAVNAGRRPIILRLLGGDYSDGSYSGSFLGKEDLGLRLGENEFFEETLRIFDLQFGADAGQPVRLWFEDSLGRRYPLPDSESQVASLFAPPSNDTLPGTRSAP